MKTERFWNALALLLAVAAVAASLQIWLSGPRHREILGQMSDDLRQIRSYSGRWAREDAFRAGLDASRAWKPVDLDELGIRLFGPGVARVTPRPAVPAAEGWHVREASVEFREASYARIEAFLAAAAAGDPAWRLREIDVKPSAEAGSGAATLVLEALEKKRNGG